MIKIHSNKLNVPVTVDGKCATNQAFTESQLLMWDKTNHVLVPATSAVTVLTIAGVTTKAQTAGPSTIEYVPIVANETQLWSVDCTNNTAATQVGDTCAMTDSNYVANTGTDVVINTGVFNILYVIGAVGDKTAVGFFNRVGTKTSAS